MQLSVEELRLGCVVPPAPTENVDRNSADGWMRRWLDGNREKLNIFKWPKTAPKASFGLNTGALGRKLREESENELKDSNKKYTCLKDKHF